MIDSDKSRFSRRTILTGIAVGAGGVGAAAMAGFGGKLLPQVTDSDGSWWDAPAVPLETAAARDWAGKVGSEFSITTEAGEKAFRLVAVRPLASLGERPSDVARTRGFLVQFESSEQGQAAGDRIYSVRHSGGAFELFFDATDAALETPLLQAVFN